LPLNLCLVGRAVLETPVMGPKTPAQAQAHRLRIITELRKLHRQLGHPKTVALQGILKVGGATAETVGMVEEACGSCATCEKVSRPRQKLVNSLPKARTFLELLRGDIVEMVPGVYFAHFVDDFSGMSFGGAVFGKTGREMSEILVSTVLTCPAAPNKMLFDNGGEFMNSEVWDLLEGYGVEVWTTAAEAPSTHGGVERHHLPLIQMMRAAKAELPSMPWRVLARQAICAKNKLTTYRGFSPIQLVYGILGVNLPDPLTETVPMGLPYEDMGEVLRQNKQAFAKMCEIWYRADVRESIQRALRENLRRDSVRVRFGDKVLYWRESSKLSTGWKGPARVVGRERGVVHLMTGGNRMIKASDRMIRMAPEGIRGPGGRLKCTRILGGTLMTSTI
jgi:hypothetical protein